MIIQRLKCFWLKLELHILRFNRFRLNLYLLWLDFQIWWWTRGLEIFDVNDEETLLREEMQGLRRMASHGHVAPYILRDRPKWIVEALKTEPGFLKEGYEDWKN